MTANSRAPRSVPETVPRPPERLAPPMMTAVNTGNRYTPPWLGCTCEMKEKSSMPPIAAMKAEMTNASVL